PHPPPKLHCARHPHRPPPRRLPRPPHRRNLLHHPRRAHHPPHRLALHKIRPAPLRHRPPHRHPCHHDRHHRRRPFSFRPHRNQRPLHSNDRHPRHPRRLTHNIRAALPHPSVRAHHSRRRRSHRRIPTLQPHSINFYPLSPITWHLGRHPRNQFQIPPPHPLLPQSCRHPLR